MKNNPRVSIVIPYHDMENGAFFLKRNLDSIMAQSFKDYEIVLTKEGRMAENINAGIRKARGEIIKILFLDDWLFDENYLERVSEEFTPDTNWLVTSADNNPNPEWNENIHLGVNTLGSPSALAVRNGLNIYFDENLSWLLDCLLYKKLYTLYGKPKIIKDVTISIGIHEDQTTNLLSDERKQWELDYIKSIYEKNTTDQ